MAAAGVSAWMIVVSIIMFFVVLACVIFLLIKFSHPDDAREAKFPKIVVVLSLTLAFISVLVMPYDVSNSRGDGGGLAINVLWHIIYSLVAFFLFFLMPYAYFYYENDMDKEDGVDRKCWNTQAGAACFYTLAVSIVFMMMLLILYASANTASVPYTILLQHPNRLVPVGEAATLINTVKSQICVPPSCKETAATWDINVTFPVYMMAFMSFLGWFFFMFFLGVGLFALPLDLINEFRTRPKPLKKKDYMEERKRIGQAANDLIETGNTLKNDLESDTPSKRQKKMHKKNYRAFEQNYYLLRQEYKKLELTQELKGQGGGAVILWTYFKFFLGCCSLILSLTWVIHIGLFILPEKPIHPFLNDFFIIMEEAVGPGFPMLGVICFAIYSYYLLWCCVKGNFKLGVRLLCWKLYPMELNGTLMNSFLVNSWFILLCSVPTVQICVQAFPIYTRLTSIEMMFGSQVQYLTGFGYFWEYNVFIITILCISFLSLIWLCVNPEDKAAKIEKQIQAGTSS